MLYLGWKVQRSLFDEDSDSIYYRTNCTKILISKLDNWRIHSIQNSLIWLNSLKIAVHHSGVTPVFREMIELLYNDGMIRLLIATETFAIGINMGIRSVIFTGLTKFDGRGFRYLYSHEYGQRTDVQGAEEKM